MLSLNLENLGITKEALIEAVLRETGLTPEQAVIELANTLGVPIMDARDYDREKEVPAPAGIQTGDIVATAQGDARAIVLDDYGKRMLADAGRFLYGTFANA